ncbi:aldo/keto reductase [Humidisolicoccus flavus]|uniref:aldo/keto reductase n=1 Tax=Humidisolicoccus flavus TaxID=3111414 RepID=UPI003254F429
MQISSLPLRSGATIPLQGYGLYKVPPLEAEQRAREAIEVGYPLLDTAAFYRNEAEVGRALLETGAREHLFLTTKFWGETMTRDEVMRDFETSMERLEIDVLDLYLIHWPRPALGTYVETWRAFVELQQAGRVRDIGVSNFTEEHIQRLITETGVVPALNQVELHPWLPQRELRAFHEQHGVVTQAWSPLARGKIMHEPTLDGIAKKHAVSVAQVVLRWHLQEGISAIPKSSSVARMRENLELHSFSLDGDDMAAIAGLESGERTGSHPETGG